MSKVSSVCQPPAANSFWDGRGGGVMPKTHSKRPAPTAPAAVAPRDSIKTKINVVVASWVVRLTAPSTKEIPFIDGAPSPE